MPCTCQHLLDPVAVGMHITCVSGARRDNAMRMVVALPWCLLPIPNDCQLRQLLACKPSQNSWLQVKGGFMEAWPTPKDKDCKQASVSTSCVHTYNSSPQMSLCNRPCRQTAFKRQMVIHPSNTPQTLTLADSSKPKQHAETLNPSAVMPVIRMVSHSVHCAQWAVMSDLHSAGSRLPYHWSRSVINLKQQELELAGI